MNLGPSEEWPIVPVAPTSSKVLVVEITVTTAELPGIARLKFNKTGGTPSAKIVTGTALAYRSA
jgi:hypothetical protein